MVSPKVVKYILIFSIFLSEYFRNYKASYKMSKDNNQLYRACFKNLGPKNQYLSIYLRGSFGKAET